MRACANCGTSIEGYRARAIHCGGPCRAAASRTRAAERSNSPRSVAESPAVGETAHNRTQRARDELAWQPASAAEEAEAERLRRKYPELWGVAA